MESASFRSQMQLIRQLSYCVRWGLTGNIVGRRSLCPLRLWKSLSAILDRSAKMLRINNDPSKAEAVKTRVVRYAEFRSFAVKNFQTVEKTVKKFCHIPLARVELFTARIQQPADVFVVAQQLDLTKISTAISCR